MCPGNIINDNIFNKDSSSSNVVTGYSGVNGVILPPLFPALVAWYDADDPEKQIINGTTVSDVFDKSSNSNNLAQAVAANQPVLNTLELNGRSTWRGDGVNLKYFDCTIAFPSLCTMFILADREVAYTATYLTRGSDFATNPAFITNFNPGAGVAAFEWYDWVTLRDTFDLTATGYHLLAITNDDNANPKLNAYFDGDWVFSGNGTNFTGRDFVGLFFDLDVYEGNIAEFAMYSVIFNQDQINLFKEYINTKWGVP